MPLRNGRSEEDGIAEQAGHLQQVEHLHHGRAVGGQGQRLAAPLRLLLDPGQELDSGGVQLLHGREVQVQRCLLVQGGAQLVPGLGDGVDGQFAFDPVDRLALMAAKFDLKPFCSRVV